jgi:signal peptidase II
MVDTVRHVLVRLALFMATALLGSGCDLHSKLWIEETLRGVPGQALTVIDPWLEFVLAYNRGTAFSLVHDLGVARTVLGVFAIVLVVGLLVTVLRSKRATRLEIIALGLIAGGALGNGLDRLLRQAPGGGTGVVDFIRIHYPWGGSWPAFNVADALLAIGAVLLFLGGIAHRRVHAARA